MKLYQTYSNDNLQRDGIYRVTINNLYIIRWSDEPLRYIKSRKNSWSYLHISKGTTTPNWWSLK